MKDKNSIKAFGLKRKNNCIVMLGVSMVANEN